MSSAAMSRVARVLERMANQNTFADVSMDFRVSNLSWSQLITSHHACMHLCGSLQKNVSGIALLDEILWYSSRRDASTLVSLPNLIALWAMQAS